MNKGSNISPNYLTHKLTSSLNTEDSIVSKDNNQTIEI